MEGPFFAEFKQISKSQHLDLYAASILIFTDDWLQALSFFYRPRWPGPNLDTQGGGGEGGSLDVIALVAIKSSIFVIRKT